MIISIYINHNNINILKIIILNDIIIYYKKMSIQKNKENIKNNRFSINRNINKKNKSHTIFGKWKIYYIDDNIEFDFLSDIESSMIIRNNKIYLRNSIIGKQLFDKTYDSGSVIQVIKFEFCKNDGTIYKLPKKHIPEIDITIRKNVLNLLDLNKGILGYHVYNTSQNNINYIPKCISIIINNQGNIILGDCEFITTENDNFYINNFNVSLK